MAKSLLISLLLFSNIICAKDYCCAHITSDFNEGILLAEKNKKDLFVMVFMDSDLATYNISVKEALKMKRRKYKTSLRTLNSEFVIVKAYQTDLLNFINSLAHKYKDALLKEWNKNKNENYVFIATTLFYQIYSPHPFWNTEMIADLIYVRFGP